MFKKIVRDLVDPNTGDAGFELFGIRVVRAGRDLSHLGDRELRGDDDIIDGVLTNVATERTFPIVGGVASMLTDQDVDVEHWRCVFASLQDGLPADLQSAVQRQQARLGAIHQTPSGDWNRGEMGYYDAQVATGDQRAGMVMDIQEKVLDRIFFPREKVILAHLKERIAACQVVEIGCGNARTIARMMHPRKFSYSYIGTDISLHRLLVARQSLRAGNFIQASALNLPLRNGCADALVAFGALHHMPSVEKTLDEGDRVLKAGGYFGFHEPIGTPKLIEGRFNKLSEWLQAYERSQHDGEIDLGRVTMQLNKKRFQPVNQMFCISPFRTAFEHFLRKSVSDSLIQNRLVSQTLFALDKLPCSVFRAILPVLGPRAVTRLCRKPAIG